MDRLNVNWSLPVAVCSQPTKNLFIFVSWSNWETLPRVRTFNDIRNDNKNLFYVFWELIIATLWIYLGRVYASNHFATTWYSYYGIIEGELMYLQDLCKIYFLQISYPRDCDCWTVSIWHLTLMSGETPSKDFVETSQRFDPQIRIATHIGNSTSSVYYEWTSC